MAHCRRYCRWKFYSSSSRFGSCGLVKRRQATGLFFTGGSFNGNESMAPVPPLVVPRTLDSHNAFLRDEPKHSVNDDCSNKPALLPNGDAKQLTSPNSLQKFPGEERLNGTASEQVEDGRREDSNETLFSDRGGSREAPGIVDQEMNGRRKVRWNDSHGNELAEVWEFQPSDSTDSDDDEEDDSQACTCVIM